MADTIDYDKLAETIVRALGGGTGPGKDGPRNVDDFKKQIKESTEALKKQLPLHKQMEGLIKGQRQTVVDLDKELEDLDKQIEGLVGTVDSADKVLLQQARDQKASAIAANNAKAATVNFAMAMGDVAQTLIKGAFQYAKDLQAGSSGVEAGTAASVTAARATGEAVSGVGSAMSAIAPILSLVGGRFGKLAGAITTVVGAILEVFGKKAASVSEEGLKFLGDELKKTQKAFKDISDTGAVFGGGMTELRNVAVSAGLDVAQLATVVRSSKDDLVGMGLGLGEATKRIAGVSKELRTSELGTQLRKLGYSAEEQASLAASVSARMSAAGDTRVRSDAEVAKMTAQYGKDLKVLGDITGQDAKKAMEKARMQAQEQDLLAEAMAKGGPEAVKKLESQLASMPESMKKGYMEFVSTGGTAIADAATNVAITQNPKIMEQYKQQFRDLQDNQVSASDAMRRTLKSNEDTAQYAKDNAAATKEVAMAARLTGNGLARGATDITNSLILTAGRQRKGATEAADAAAEAAAKNVEPLDVAVAKIEEDAQTLRAAMTNELTPAVTMFAKGLAAASTTVAETMEKMGLREKGTGEKVGDVAGGLVGSILGGKGGAALGAAIGTAILPGFGTAIGGGIGWLAGGAAGGVAGSWLGGKAGRMADEPKKFATGGIVDGPTRAIIGEAGVREAVIPLPNGKSVPLDLDVGAISNSMAEVALKALKMTPMGMAASALTNALNTNQSGTTSTSDDQVAVLQEILDTLKTSKDLQQQYVYNTFN